MLMAYAEKMLMKRTIRKRHKSLNIIKERDSNPNLTYENKNFFMEEGIENIQRYFDFCGHTPKFL